MYSGKYHRHFNNKGEKLNIKSMAYVNNLAPTVLEHWARLTPGQLEATSYVDKPDMTSREIASVVASALGQRVPGPPLPTALAAALIKPVDILARAMGRSGNP